MSTGHSLASAKRLTLLDSRCALVKILNMRQRSSTRMERPMHKAAALGTARLRTLPTTTESAKNDGRVREEGGRALGSFKISP